MAAEHSFIHSTRAYQYAVWCAKGDNEKTGKYVKRQAEQWIRIADGENEEAFVDEEAVIKTYELLGIMVHPDLRCSMLEGIEDYAHLFIIAVLCTKKVDQRNRDIRYYTTAVLEICRKNFKTFNAAVIFVILMLTEPRFSRFFSVAPDLKLSSELKVAVKKIIKSSPLLEEEKNFKLLRSEVRCLLTESEYVPLAYSEDKMDGKLANAFLTDEAGAMDSYPTEAMRSSQITLLNKLGIIISTQYPNDDNGMIDEIDKAKKVLDGILNRRVFALLYEPDDELKKDDLWQTDDRVLYQANPVAVSNEDILENLKERRADAILYPRKRQNFLCKHCNIKYRDLGVEGYIDVLKLRECRIPENKEFWKGKRVWLGLDLSQTEDNTAVAMATIDDGILYGKAWGFLPENKVMQKTKKEKVDYEGLIEKGNCFACGEEVIDYGFVEQFVLSLEEEYGVEVVQLGYDRYNAISTVQKLEGDEEHPIECVEIIQHSKILHGATKYLKEQILKKEFQYEENDLLEINFQNARCTEDTNLNKYVNKKKSTGKVDMVVALIMAVYLLMNDMLIGGEGWGAQVI